MKERIARIIRFGIVGGSATAIDAIIYAMLVMKLPLNVSKLTSMICACTFSYVLQKNWTFQDSGKSKKKVFLFIFAQVINITVNVKMNEFIFDLLQNKIYAFVIATGTAMVVNYCLQHWVVFRKE